MHAGTGVGIACTHACVAYRLVRFSNALQIEFVFFAVLEDGGIGCPQGRGIDRTDGAL